MSKKDLEATICEEFIIEKEEAPPERKTLINDEHNNAYWLVIDAKAGVLDHYAGTFVVYWHGNLHGQSESKSWIKRKASTSLESDYVIFGLPKNLDEIKSLDGWMSEDILKKYKVEF